MKKKIEIFFSGLGWTGELWSNLVSLKFRNKEDFFLLQKNLKKKLEFFEKKVILLPFLKFLEFLDFLLTFGIFCIFFSPSYFLNFLFFIFIYFLFFISILILFLFGFLEFLRLLLKVTKVTTEDQKWPKMGQNSIISGGFSARKRKPRPKAEALRRSCK